ncbi:MAG: hypothetical protein SNJ62_10300 [Chloracidobacterium sp.]
MASILHGWKATAKWRSLVIGDGLRHAASGEGASELVCSRRETSLGDRPDAQSPAPPLPPGARAHPARVPGT